MKLWKFIKEYKWIATLGFLFKVTEAILELSVPVVMAKIIDEGVKNQDLDIIMKYGVLLVGLGVGGYLCALVCQYYASLTSQSVGTKLRTAMYQKIQTFDQGNIDQITSSSLINRMTNDIIQIQLAIAMTIRLTSRAPFLIVGSLILSFVISPTLSMIFIFGAIVLAISMISITILSNRYYRHIQVRLDKLTRYVRQTMEGNRVIRAFSRQKEEIKRFQQANNKQKEAQIKVGNMQALLNPLTYVIVNIAILVILYQGSFLIDTGMLQQGEIIALTNYMTQILLALIVFTNVLTIYNKANSSYQRIVEVFETNPSVQDTGNNQSWKNHHTAVSFQNVSFGYGKKEIIENVSFEVLQGQTIGIIGGIGSGKTTLVKLLSRYYETSMGTILLDGKDIKEYSLESLRSFIGYVDQHPSMLAGTIEKNLLMAKPNASKEEIDEALHNAQAYEFVYQKEAGLQREIEQGARNLSGGQIQRLAIARAFLKKPKVLVLDDSSSALDYVTDKKIRQYLKTQDLSTIIITQRIAAIEHASKIVVLYHGKVVGFDSHENLLRSCTVYKEIYDTQTKGVQS